ncbi:hypothetical protein ES692_05690 [Psychroserpens burtonensis]|uniref:Uncharacterized protein n=1 Tax=Psychroserpens burtonensis TaxID=49278 RepID=A0A5C7BBI1_9FLAO|nr:hypothetical protein [Psychroserpens burtonensis]TXE18533.1 hypothetical protein ES692_05690 [Psychroserpens burtonensis]
MKKQNFIECERKGLEKLINFRLPHYFYTIGIAVLGTAIVMMFIRAFVLEGDQEVLKVMLQRGLLIGMLLMSIAKDKDEDEMVVKLRMQSYTYAFVAGVVYALIMPFVDYGVSNVVNSGGEEFHDIGDFQVLLFMLMIQLLCFHTLKRVR